jgi:hypothetical protein
MTSPPFLLSMVAAASVLTFDIQDRSQTIVHSFSNSGQFFSQPRSVLHENGIPQGSRHQLFVT